MKIKNLINKSHYGTIGYISSQEDLEVLESYILYNLEILKEYQQIIVATNYKNYPELVEENSNLWKKYFPNCILLDSKINRGHNHGYTDLDNLIVDYCKDNNIEWLCKSSNDTIIQPIFLTKDIPQSDFYYLNGIGYGGMVKYDFNNERIIAEDFYPQNNFYFINVSKIDYLNDKKFLDDSYEYIKSIPDYNGKIWEYIKEWTCERLLKKCVKRNNLKIHHLIPKGKYIKLLNHVKQTNTHDCSHKNLLIEGICHFHFPNHPLYEI
tara:strand:- start:172 stop:969 length:798 start_codon:yes stop_codon:yes gene_type:complete